METIAINLFLAMLCAHQDSQKVRPTPFLLSKELITYRSSSFVLLPNAYYEQRYKCLPEWTFYSQISSVPWKCQKKCTMLLRDKGLQSSLQKIVTFMFQALVLVHNIVTSIWYIYFCCTALCSLLLSFYSIVTHSKAENCHFDVSCFYREAKYLHFLPVFDDLIKGT